MREISLTLLDLAQNSIKVEASLIEIEFSISEKRNLIEFTIDDNGYGMTNEELEKVTDPFFTSRAERRVGLGVPFCKLACEQAGGSFSITSEKDVGTKLYASFQLDHIDRQPVGDLAGSVLFIVTASEKSDVIFKFKTDETDFSFDSREAKEILGGLPINTPDVVSYLEDMFRENIKITKG